MESPPRAERPGLEARLLRAWRAFLVAGTVLPMLLGGALWWLLAGAVDSASHKQLLRMLFTLAGWVVFYWTVVITLGIGCWIVQVMKGPQRQADSYSLPGAPDRFIA